jgi:hypothetical protein
MLLLPVPHWFTNSALLMNAATWAILATESSVAILVWNRRLRPWVLAAGVVMHTVIMITITVGFFTLAMFVFYLAFVPPETVQQLPSSARRMTTKLVCVLRRRWPKIRNRSGNSETEHGGLVVKGSACSSTEAPDHR